MGHAKRKEKMSPPSSPDAGAAEGQSPATDFERWEKPASLSKRGWMVLGGFLLLLQVPLLHRFFRPPPPTTVTVPFEDRFDDPDTVQKNYWSSGGHLRVVEGWLLAPGVKNNPLWLKASLPRDVVVEFDARSETPEGDIKVEIFGNGTDHASGYILIHGGWNNTLSVLARLEEHGQDSRGNKKTLKSLQEEARRQGLSDVSAETLKNAGLWKENTQMLVEGRRFPVEPGRTYHWRIERRGARLQWFIDGERFIELDDPFPLEGKAHDRFGFSNWESQVTFDNLSIRPL